MTKAGYFILFLAIVGIVLAGYNAILTELSVNKKDRIKKTLLIGGSITLWTVYAFILATIGFFQNFSLPPRFPLFLVFPVFIFIGVFLYQNRNSEILDALPKSWVVYFQSFRIAVELLFVASFAEGVLHREVTFHGYNYDILVGLTAPLIAFLAFNKKIISEKIVLIWNFLGLGVLATVVFTFISTTFFPFIWGAKETLANPEFATFPYVLVASFLMPIAVFMHIVSIMQLTRKNKA